VVPVSPSQLRRSEVADGSVRRWGSNGDGQLGDGTKMNADSPLAVQGLSGAVKELSGNVTSACALLSTGGIECWGLNNVGQLGNGTKNDSLVPIPVTGFP